MRPTIRQATIRDVTEIIALERQVSNAAHWSAEQYETRVEGNSLLVAENNSQLVAFICVRALPGEWEIENVVVHEALRRQGLASALLASLFDLVRLAGNPMLHLEVRESNLAARELYAKHGFNQVGKRPNYYRDPSENAILYRKS